MKSICLLVLLFPAATHAVQYSIDTAAQTLTFTDLSGLTWHRGYYNATMIESVIAFYVYGTGTNTSRIQCNSMHTGSPNSNKQCWPPNDFHLPDCNTAADADNAIRVALGKPIKFIRYTPTPDSITFSFSCNIPHTWDGWTAGGTAHETTPASCAANDIALHIRTVTGQSGTARDKLNVVCTRKTDVMLSLSSETLHLTHGGSAKLALNGQGPSLNLQGVTDAVVEVSATVNDTTLPAGVYDGSTVITIAPL